MPGLVVESTEARNIVGQLAQGDDIITALGQVCREQNVRCASLRCGGWLEDVLLVHRAPGEPAIARQLEGPLQVVSATGTISEREGQLDVALDVVGLRRQAGQLELMAGRCTRGVVVACEVAIAAMDDLMLRRGTDPATGLDVWVEALSASGVAAEPEVVEQEEPPAESVARAALPPKPSTLSRGSKPSWPDAVAASRPEEGADARLQRDRELRHQVEVGDVIDHQKFGRCLVQRVDLDQEYATVRLRNGRLVRLNLEVLNVRYTGDEEGHQVFCAAPQGG